MNIGLNKLFSNELSQINFNYNLKKLYQGVLHTGTISYTQKIPEYGLGLTPAFSINKFNYTNVGLLLNKQWKGTLYTNFYLDNIFGFIIDNVMSSRLGLGLEIYILF